jgi:hypothetical protein
MERQNLITYVYAPLTRPTNAFSKKAENHVHMVVLYTTWYNFAWLYKTLRCPSAMAAKLSDHLWSMKDVVALIDVRATKPNHPAAYKKALRKKFQLSQLLTIKPA